MKKHSFTFLFVLWICVLTSAVAAQGYPRAGAQAELSTIHHQVSGTATIVNSNTIRVDEFYYDGQGPGVYFYLGTNATDAAFENGIYFTNLLTRAVGYTNETLTVSLSGGQTLDGYHGISVWCKDFAVDFGSGTFQPHIASYDYSNGVASLSVSGAPGESYELQATTNLVDWTGLDLQTNTTGTVSWSETNGLAMRFYRIEVQ